jgi:hypothetical protein
MAGAGAGAAAAAAAATSAATSAGKSELSPRPLAFWIEQEAFLQKQLKDTPVPVAANIAGLECFVENGRITFQESNFSRLSSNTKTMRMRVNKLTGDVPSYTQLLADQQDFFYPFFVMTPGKPLYDLKDTLALKHTDPIDLDGLYRGDYDDTLATIEHTGEKTKRLLDQMRTNLLPRIHSFEDNGKPLCVYFFHTYSFELHALAGIFWKKGGVVYAGFYDTIYYKRKKIGYDQFLGSIYIVWEKLFREAGIRSKILNLSQLCIRTEKGRHCVQYVMDAEYCSIYVFYFFYLYAKHKYPTNMEDIKKVIREAYVVEPAHLKRGACKYTNQFALTLTQFAMNTILLYTKDPARHVETYNAYNEVLEKEGYPLLTPDMYEIAKASVAARTSRGGGGGRRKTIRRYARRVQTRSRRMRR